MKNRGWDRSSRSNSARCSEPSAQPASRLVSHLLGVSLKRAPRDVEATFPFSVRAIRTLPPLDLSGQVTFFVGENGSGKSTLLEGIAAAAGLPTVGGSEVGRDGTLAPLSPQNQLGLLALLLDLVHQDAQFIIATHSPMLLAFPGATIYSFDTAPVTAVAYGDLDHVALTRDFLNDPQAFLRRLR